MTDKLLRRPEVLRKIGISISRSTLHRLVARNKFPRPVELGARIVAWRESDIDAWIKALRPAATYSSTAGAASEPVHGGSMHRLMNALFGGA